MQTNKKSILGSRVVFSFKNFFSYGCWLTSQTWGVKLKLSFRCFSSNLSHKYLLLLQQNIKKIKPITVVRYCLLLSHCFVGLNSHADQVKSGRTIYTFNPVMPQQKLYKCGNLIYLLCFISTNLRLMLLGLSVQCWFRVKMSLDYLEPMCMDFGLIPDNFTPWSLL